MKRLGTVLTLLTVLALVSVADPTWDMMALCNPRAVTGGGATYQEITNGMTLRYNLAGDVNDSWSNHNGTAANIAYTNGISGNANGAANFNGGNSVIDCNVACSALFANSNSTVSMWVRMRAAQPPGTLLYQGAALWCDKAGANIGVYSLLLSGNLTLSWYIYNNQYVNVIYTPESWLQVTAVHSNGVSVLYTNGAYVGRVAAGNADLGTRNLQLGFASYFTNYFNGDMAKVRVYNRGISPAEDYTNYMYSLENP